MKTAVMPILIVFALGSIATAGRYWDPHSLEWVDTADFVNSNSVVRDGIESFMGTDRGIYMLGEDVRMLFGLTNLMDNDVTLTAPHSTPFDLWVQEDGQNICTVLEGFLTVIVELDLAPGETAGVSGNWDMRYKIWGDPRSDQLVGAGPYDVVGGYSGTAHQASVPIIILPTDRLPGWSRPPLAPVTTAATGGFLTTASERLQHARTAISYGTSTGPLLAMAGPDDRMGNTTMYDVGPNGHTFALGNGTDYFADQKWGVWGRGYGAFGDRESEGGVPGHQYTVLGTGFGVDYQFTDRLLLGVTGGYFDGDVDYASSRDKSAVEGRSIGLYSGYKRHDWYFDSLVTYTDLEYETKRFVDLLNERPEGDFDGYQISGYFEAGFDWDYDEDCVLQPLASFQFSYLNLDGYTESGGATSLAYDEQSYESYKGSLGVRQIRELCKRADGRNAVLELRARWVHEFGDATSSVDAHFASNPGTVFAVSDEAISRRDSAVLGVGLNCSLGGATRVFFDYDASLNGEHTVHVVSAALEHRW